MRRFLLALSFSLLSTAAFAAPPTDASVDDLLGAMQAEKMVNAMYGYVEQTMRQSMATATQGQALTPQQQRRLETLPQRFAQVMRDEMSWEKMKPLYVQIYQESFSQEEIDGLTAFYKSPAGVAYVNKMPAVLQRTQVLMQTRLGPIMERMKAAAQQAVDEPKTK